MSDLNNIALQNCNGDENDDIIFILAHNVHKREETRIDFEANLSIAGLELSHIVIENVMFTKIAVPEKVFYQYAEILKLYMPLDKDVDRIEHNCLFDALSKQFDLLGFNVNRKVFPRKEHKLTAEFSRQRLYLFDMNNPDYSHFYEYCKISVVNYILERTQYGEDKDNVGIKKIIGNDNVYTAAYPLHDGTLSDINCTRKKLSDEWGSLWKWYKYQPIDEIKDYFGVKIAMYFAWLGFYNQMLIPASIMGILCIVYAGITLPSDKLSHDICTKDITMCPQCDKYCPFWKLNETCFYSKISYLVDNPATIVFSIFMSVWSAIYLELWKRYSAEITHRWGLLKLDIDAEPDRPEHSKKDEKYYWSIKLPSLVFSYTIVIFWMLLALAVVLGVVLYQMTLRSEKELNEDSASYKIYVVPVTSALINLLGIQILQFFYNKITHWLTDLENHRTQMEYEDSLTLKTYLFQFVNLYSSIIYIALFKGKFVGYPAKYNKIFGLRQQECQPGGCLMELTIQLAIIMIGNQAIGNIVEILFPYLMKKYKMSRGIQANDDLLSTERIMQDYKLSSFEPEGLFGEYLEMVVQYGFVTIFVVAFPLAPFFALLNNIFEVRLDATKFLKFYRRPVPRRVKDIGVWFHILGVISRLSIVMSAYILAFSSQFIPKLVYMMKMNKDHTEDGFLEYSLAVFNTEDFQLGAAPLSNPYNITTCRYMEYRNPPNQSDPTLHYKRPVDYWHITTARLAFMVVYQNLIGVIFTCIQWIIPDMPKELNKLIKDEAKYITEAIIEKETEINEKEEKLKLTTFEHI